MLNLWEIHTVTLVLAHAAHVGAALDALVVETAGSAVRTCILRRHRLPMNRYATPCMGSFQGPNLPLSLIAQ